MIEYKSGDIVKVFYLFIPKVVSEEKEESSKGKVRYGLVIAAGNNNTMALPILGIMSHGGKTRTTEYILRDDEVKVPEGTSFFKRSKGIMSIDGVIKTERIEFFDDDEISKTLTKIGLDTKIAVLETYKKILNIPYYVKKMNKESPGHQQVMDQFEHTIIAEKLGFITTEFGEFKYENVENQFLHLHKIQDLGPSDTIKRVHFYAVELTDEEGQDSFFYTFATLKQKKQIAKDWGKSKTANEWLKEDERFYRLQKNINCSFDSVPIPHPNKYITFASFKRKSLDMELER